MDGVATGLDSWSCLQSSFGWLARLQRLQARLPRRRWLSWAHALVSAARHVATDREVAATTAFVLAQRYAAAQLAALLDAEAAVQQGKGMDGGAGGMVTGMTGQLAGCMILVFRVRLIAHASQLHLCQPQLATIVTFTPAPTDGPSNCPSAFLNLTCRLAAAAADRRGGH